MPNKIKWSSRREAGLICVIGVLRTEHVEKVSHATTSIKGWDILAPKGKQLLFTALLVGIQQELEK